ncbi:hypothetical protein SNEBB_010427 [Seison nebaliae]|nr:hypothetical protein SNEBB_010427 [Seison nebaliae]
MEMKDDLPLYSSRDDILEKNIKLSLSERMMADLIEEVTPLNGFLLCIILYLLYKMIINRYRATIGNVEKIDEELEIISADLTLEELKIFNGIDNPRIFLAADGIIYDVTSASPYYGPNGPYSLFAGNDCTYLLATMSVNPEDVKKNYCKSDFDKDEMETLENWIERFKEKYRIVGHLVKNHENGDGEERNCEDKLRERKTIVEDSEIAVAPEIE